MSELELRSEFTSSFFGPGKLLSSFVVGWTCTELLAVLLVLLGDPARSRSTSESLRLRLSSELESCTARLSVVLSLRDGELGTGITLHGGEG